MINQNRMFKIMKKKKWNSRGVTRMAAILIAGILIMLVLLLVPLALSAKESVARDLDARHEQTAEDSALMKVVSDGAFEAVYDAELKRFVPLGQIREVTAYGSSEEHKGKVIYVQAEADGTIHLQWIASLDDQSDHDEQGDESEGTAEK